MLHSIDEQGNTAHICPHCQQKNEHDINHEKMEWMSDADLVGLPRCDCGTRTFAKTRFSAQELALPVIQKDEYGKIASVQFPGAPDLWSKVTHLEKNEVGEIVEIIDAVVQHPAIARHQALAGQLYAVQKYPLVQMSVYADEGIVQWNCPGCQQLQSAHVSHPEVQQIPLQGTIALPMCACGVRAAIKIEQPEPQPVCLMVAGPDGQPATIEGVPAEQAQLLALHQKFLGQLQQVGKLAQKEGS